MIHEVDLALRSLIERDATDGSEVEVVFDAPTKDWASRRNVPTIDVYLYDIREDLRRRERGLINEYDARDRITHRHLPPRHFKLSYLVTAWTQRPEDEHRLLAALLSCFLRYDAIPPDLVTGPLAEMGLPVPLTVALPPPEDRSFADVWSALGGELKPSLDVVVSAPTDTGQRYKAGPPVVQPGKISFGGVGSWPPSEDRAAHNGTANGRQPARDGDGDGGGGGDGSATAGRTGSGAGAGSGTVGGDARREREKGSAATTVASHGMSWSEFANSATNPAGQFGVDDPAAAANRATTDDPGDSTGSAGNDSRAGKGAAAKAAAGADKTKPPARRRRQGGISQQ